MDEPSIHDHETRIALIERQCGQCPESFKSINLKLDEIQKAITNLKIEEARGKGFKTALWGGGGAGVVMGAIKAISYLFTKPQ